MIAAIIRWSIYNRFLVTLAAVLVSAAGLNALWQTPLDALPDLSDTQVIVRTTFPGQAPQVVEDQVTYPLASTLLSVPHARTVRGYSMYGESFVHILFDDDVDLYWARSRVLEYLSQVQSQLPETARTALGPDATGVGWIYAYTLVDRTGQQDLAQLTTLQQRFLQYELKSLPGVAEVATVGGMVPEYQIVPDPERLQQYGIPLEALISAVESANGEAGGASLELAEAEYRVRARGYLGSLEDFRDIPVTFGERATPVLLRDVAEVRRGPALRRGIAELNGEGEVVGGIIVMRSGANARGTIEAVTARLQTLAASLPEGVEVVETYNRAALIERAVRHLGEKLLEEFAVVAVVCALFLWHLRSALVAVITLPVALLMAFLMMRMQGLNANIMSLGGIAIAVGAMVDAAVVMIENAHKRLEAHRTASGRDAQGAERLGIIAEAAAEVGPALFYSLMIITLSFIPVFTLEAQEGRLFAPLAYTKTWAMAAAALLSVTLVPMLMAVFIRGPIAPEQRNPLNRGLMALYRPALTAVLRHPRTTVMVAVVLTLASAWPLSRLGSEFMPPLEEGDLLYMPTALPGLSAGKAAQLLQQTDRILKTFPEVETVFGKIGRADTATDPAPLEMIETTIRLKPPSDWRPGMTREKLVAEMDAALQIPGLANVWVQPIRNRIDMLATGIKSPVGVKIAGPDLNVIAGLADAVVEAVQPVTGTASAFAERVTGGRYIDITPDRVAAARYGLTQRDVQRIVSVAIGGRQIGETVEGLNRFPITVRYPHERRDTLQALRSLPIFSAGGQQLTLGSVATIEVVDGPPMIKSEDGRPSGWVYIDIRDRDLGGYVEDARAQVAAAVPLPAGYSLRWSGQFEALERARDRLWQVVPFTLVIIFVLLYLCFRRPAPALLVMASLPFALVGSIWLLFALGHHLSIASAVGLIALAGVAAEFGVVMLLYLDNALAEARQAGRLQSEADLRRALMEGAVLRLRPKVMTVATIIAGLIPLFMGSGAGGEIMQRIAAPMLGGMISAPLLSLLVMPAAYLLIQRRGLVSR